MPRPLHGTMPNTPSAPQRAGLARSAFQCAALLLAATAVQAQTTSPSPAASAASAVRSAAASASAAVSGAMPGATAASAASRSDRSFVQDAASDGLAEVLLGQLAQQRAARADVRQFAERMVADHTKANDELKSLAQAHGLQLPDRPTAAQQRMHDGMAKLQGEEFDRLYMAHMQSDHRKAVSLFQKQARSGDDAALKAFAAKTLPTLLDHLKTADTLHDSLKKSPRR